MRPKSNEKKTDFVQRFMQEVTDLPEEERASQAIRMWEAGPVPEEQLPSPEFDACCGGITKMDIPEVQAVILMIEPVIERVWDEMLDAAALQVSEASKDEQGPEWILLLTMSLWQALLGASARQEYLQVFRDAAARLGAGEKAYTAAQDMMLSIRGRFHLLEDGVRSILLRRPKNRAMLRSEFEGVFGPTRKWSAPLADTWAYKWRWIGDALTLRRLRTAVFRYWNPLDERTTPFCQWLVRSGRTVTVGKILQRVNQIERAIVENNVEMAIKAYPLLSFTGRETDADFNRLYQANDLAAPPFHWRCRTRLLPI